MTLLLSLKDDCRMDHPRILPRIVDCVDYTNYHQVRFSIFLLRCFIISYLLKLKTIIKRFLKKKYVCRDLHDLLERWPRVPVECALQLLDQSYPDEKVHDFAVQSLR